MSKKKKTFFYQCNYKSIRIFLKTKFWLNKSLSMKSWRPGCNLSKTEIYKTQYHQEDSVAYWPICCTVTSSSSCPATSMDIPDSLSPLRPIIHRFWQVLRATSHILTELLYVGSSLSPCFCSTMWGGSIGEHHLWVCPYFSSSVLHVWFV